MHDNIFTFIVDRHIKWLWFYGYASKKNVQLFFKTRNALSILIVNLTEKLFLFLEFALKLKINLFEI